MPAGVEAQRVEAGTGQRLAQALIAGNVLAQTVIDDYHGAWLGTGPADQEGRRCFVQFN